MEPEQAEDRTERIECLGRVADDARGRFGRRERLAGLAGDEKAFGAQDMGDRILGRKRNGAAGAHDGGVWPTTLQRGFGQHGPSAAIIGSDGKDLRADPFGSREVAARQGAAGRLRAGGNLMLSKALQASLHDRRAGRGPSLPCVA
jgi:hypothetical protein